VLVREGVIGNFHYLLEAERSEMETPYASVPTGQQGKAGEITDAQGAVLDLEEAPAQIKPPAGWGAVETADEDAALTPEAEAEIAGIIRDIVGFGVMVERVATGDAHGIAAGIGLQHKHRLQGLGPRRRQPGHVPHLGRGQGRIRKVACRGGRRLGKEESMSAAAEVNASMGTFCWRRAPRRG
jgi:hypothetical protein